MLHKNRYRNPVWTQSDVRIRQLLADELAPDAERDALLAKQIAKLRALKTEEDPHWQDVRQPRVETQVVRDVLSFDGMVRSNRRA